MTAYGEDQALARRQGMTWFTTDEKPGRVMDAASHASWDVCVHGDPVPGDCGDCTADLPLVPNPRGAT